MNTASALRVARRSAGLSQAEVAIRAGTSQATISAYENGGKQPSVDTFDRILAAAGMRLAVVAQAGERAVPSAAAQRRTARALGEVLRLAEALPTRHAPELRYPRLPERRT